MTITITNLTKLHAVEREIALRTRVYPRLVEDGKLSADRAEREIEIMKAIAEDYRAILQRENPDLFSAEKGD